MINTACVNLLKIRDYETRRMLERQIWWELMHQLWAEVSYPVSDKVGYFRIHVHLKKQTFEYSND